MNFEEQHFLLCCTFCKKSEDDTELIDIESNSMKFDEVLHEFGDLIYEVLNFKVSFIDAVSKHNLLP